MITNLIFKNIGIARGEYLFKSMPVNLPNSHGIHSLLHERP
jgi:hypothetical protein